MSDRAGYFCNVWEHRERGGLYGEIHNNLTDALAEIAEGSRMFIYVETIVRSSTGMLTRVDLSGDALNWDHERTRAERAESERLSCYTKQRRAG